MKKRLQLLAKHLASRVKEKTGLSGYRLIKKMPHWPEDRKYAAYLSFDIDYKEDESTVPIILNVLKKNQVKASFACIGKMVENDPDAYKKIASEGHELVNHSYSHPLHKILNKRKWSDLSENEVREEITGCHKILKDTIGYAPAGFRTPHFDFGNEKNVLKTIKELNYLYDSSGYDPAYSPYGSYPLKNKGVIEIPCYRKISSYYCMRYKKVSMQEWNGLIQAAMEKEKKYGGVACFYFDPQDFKENIEILENIIKKAREDNAWITDMKGLASWVNR